MFEFEEPDDEQYNPDPDDPEMDPDDSDASVKELYGTDPQNIVASTPSYTVKYKRSWDTKEAITNKLVRPIPGTPFVESVMVTTTPAYMTITDDHGKSWRPRMRDPLYDLNTETVLPAPTISPPDWMVEHSDNHVVAFSDVGFDVSQFTDNPGYKSFDSLISSVTYAPGQYVRYNGTYNWVEGQSKQITVPNNAGLAKHKVGDVVPGLGRIKSITPIYETKGKMDLNTLNGKNLLSNDDTVQSGGPGSFSYNESNFGLQTAWTTSWVSGTGPYSLGTMSDSSSFGGSNDGSSDSE